jgi:hypothetical protein
LSLPALLGLLTCGLVIGLQDTLDPRVFGPLEHGGAVRHSGSYLL